MILIAVLVALAVAPAAFLVRTVVTHWVNVPHMDQWDISHVFIWHRSGRLSFNSLISQHNESRKLFPRLLFLGMGLLSGWDVRWEMVLIMVMAALISVNLFFLLRRLRGDPWWHLGALVLLNMMLFSPVQWDNWLWGIQLVVFVPPLMLTVGLVTVSTGPLWRRAMVRSLLAFIATFSYANGMLLWALLLPTDFVGLPARPREKRDHPWLAAVWYILSAAATLRLYFHDYHQPPGKPPGDLALRQPLEALRYFLAWVGSPLVPEGSTLSLATRITVGGWILAAFIAGVVVVASTVPRKALHRVLPWGILGMYGTISGVATTFGRLGFGIQHAADSRYTTFSIYPLLAAIGVGTTILPRFIRRGRREALAVGGCTTVLVGALVVFHVKAVGVSQGMLTRFSQCIDEGRLGLQLHKVFYDEMRIRFLYPNARFVLIRGNELSEMGMLGTPVPDPGTFWERRRPGDPGEQEWGFLDACRRAGPVNLECSGWVRNPVEGRPGDNVVLVWTNEEGVSAPFAIRRVAVPMPHIAAIMREPALLPCGFRSSVGTSLLPSGRLEISAWTVDSDSEQAHQLAHPVVIIN